MAVIDFAEIPENGDGWELFARDYFEARGLIVEEGPDAVPMEAVTFSFWSHVAA